MSPSNSTPPFNPAGMSGIYTAANLTLQYIFPPYEEILDFNYSKLQGPVNAELIQDIVFHTKGPLGFVVGIVLFGIILTIVGFGLCLAKCCKKKDELLKLRTKDKCQRSCCGILFGTLVVAFMLFLVASFVTNSELNKSIKGLPTRLDKSLDITEKYLDKTKEQVRTLFVNNFDTLEMSLVDTLEKSGDIIKNGLSDKTGLVALKNLTDLLDTVTTLRTSLTTVKGTADELTIQAKQLEIGLGESKARLLKLLDDCGTPECQHIKQDPEIQGLRVESEFQKLPNTTSLLEDLNNLLKTDVERSINRGKSALDELSLKIQSKVKNDIPKLKKKIRLTGNELKNYSMELEKAIDQVPLDRGRDGIQKVEEFIVEWGPYGNYVGLSATVMFTFIFSLLTFGLFIGCCGKQPGVDNECCSRKTGAKFIGCGIFFIFLTVMGLGAVTLVYFAASGVLTQVFCPSIWDNRTEALLGLPTLELKGFKGPSWTTVLGSCKENTAAYVAFNLQSKYSVKGLVDLSNRFREEVDRLATQVEVPEDWTRDIEFLSTDAKSELLRFANSRVTKIDFKGFVDELSTSKLTTFDFTSVTSRLNASVQSRELPLEITTRLMNEIVFLNGLRTQVFEPMSKNVRQSIDTLEDLAMEQKDLKSRVLRVVEAAAKASGILKGQGLGTELTTIARQFSTSFLTNIDDYANFTHTSITQKVGSCRPLYDAYNASATAICVNVGLPLSGYWFSITCLLLIFFPLLIVGGRLSKLWRKVKGGVYESETFYSTNYGNDDTIPLSNIARPKRAHSRTSSRFDDTSHGAHKAWANHHTPPNGPGEYERPPPYYYPGPAQQ